MIDLSEIPESLKEGENWELLDLDKEWIWLARDGDEVVGFLMACNCHGLAIIWRVKMIPGHGWALGRLLRDFIRDLRKRKILGYVTFLDIITRSEEQALMRILFRAGAKFTHATTLICGSVATRHVGGE